MGLIEGIVLVALTTAIAAWIKFYYPIIQQAYFLKLDNSFTRSPFISGSVFFTVSLLVFPLMILPTIVPSMERQFMSGLESVILAEDV